MPTLDDLPEDVTKNHEEDIVQKMFTRASKEDTKNIVISNKRQTLLQSGNPRVTRRGSGSQRHVEIGACTSQGAT